MIIKETKDKFRIYFKNIFTYIFFILIFLAYTFTGIQALNKADTFILDNIYGTALILNIYIIALPLIAYLNIYMNKDLFKIDINNDDSKEREKRVCANIFADTLVLFVISAIPFIFIYIFNYLVIRLNISLKHTIYTALLIFVYSFLTSCILNIFKNININLNIKSKKEKENENIKSNKKILFKNEIFLVSAILLIYLFTILYLTLKRTGFNFEFNMMYVKMLDNLKSLQDILIVTTSLVLIYAVSVKIISRRISNGR